MVTRKSATLSPVEQTEIADLFSDAAIAAEMQRMAARKAAAQVEKDSTVEQEYLVVKRISPLVTKVHTKLGYGTGSECSEHRYQPGWQVNRLTAKGTIWAGSAEEATLKAQRRALGDKKGTLDADEAAYWTNHLSQGTWGHGTYAAQAAPVKAVPVKDLSGLKVVGNIPPTPDIADIDRRIAYWTKDGDKEMVKSLKALRRDLMHLKA